MLKQEQLVMLIARAINVSERVAININRKGSYLHESKRSDLCLI